MVYRFSIADSARSGLLACPVSVLFASENLRSSVLRKANTQILRKWYVLKCSYRLCKCSACSTSAEEMWLISGRKTSVVL